MLTEGHRAPHHPVRIAAAREAAEIAGNQSSDRTLTFQRMKSKTKKRIHRTSSIDNTLTLTFLTLEERLRRLRRAAITKEEKKPSHQRVDDKLKSNEMLQELDQGGASKELLVDMKFLFQSVFVFLRAPDPTDPPHRVINRSLHWKVSICWLVAVISPRSIIPHIMIIEQQDLLPTAWM